MRKLFLKLISQVGDDHIECPVKSIVIGDDDVRIVF